MKFHSISNRPGKPLTRWVVFLAALALVAAPLVFGQEQGVIEGRLINGTDRSHAPAGMKVEVVSLSQSMRPLKSATSDAAGRFRFEGLPAGMPLLVRTEYGSVPYYTQAAFDSSGRARVEIEVFEPSANAKNVRVDSLEMAFQLTGDKLRALQSYTFQNEGTPPRSYVNPEGDFHFSKAPEAGVKPRLSVLAPGSTMRLTLAPLEGKDGASYYTLYPLRPGATTFEVDQELPYRNRTYTFRKKFFYDVASFHIGVIPKDVEVTAAGLVKQESPAGQDFAVYSGGPIKAGTEVEWTFSGGTPVAAAPAVPQDTGPRIEAVPTFVARNALLLGPLMLTGLILVLLYAFNSVILAPAKKESPRELAARRDALLDEIADLDRRFESGTIDRRRYARLREQGKRRLRRIAVVLAKKGREAAGRA